MGKHKYSKGLGFLHIPHSSISHVIETHTIPWEIWIIIVEERLGKHKHSKATGLLHISCKALIHNSQNMGKVNFHSKEKIWENTGISKLRVSYIFHLEQNSMQLPKHGKKDFHSTRKVWGNTKHLKFMGFLNILGKIELHKIPKTREKWIPIIRRKCGKNKHGFLKHSGWRRYPLNSQNMGKVNSHCKGKIWQSTNISNWGFLTCLVWSRNLSSSQSMGKVDFHSTGKVWETTNILHLWVC